MLKVRSRAAVNSQGRSCAGWGDSDARSPKRTQARAIAAASVRAESGVDFERAGTPLIEMWMSRRCGTFSITAYRALTRRCRVAAGITEVHAIAGRERSVRPKGGESSHPLRNQERESASGVPGISTAEVESIDYLIDGSTVQTCRDRIRTGTRLMFWKEDFSGYCTSGSGSSPQKGPLKKSLLKQNF